MAYLWVALGGALGSVARYGCSGIAARWLGIGFPYGTMFVNVSGSFMIGVLGTLALGGGRALASTDARAFLIVGLLGGFTTFSSFSLETLNLARAGAWAQRREHRVVARAVSDRRVARLSRARRLSAADRGRPGTVVPKAARDCPIAGRFDPPTRASKRPGAPAAPLARPLQIMR